MIIKKTALYDQHVSLGGQMVEFANTWLPVRYHSEKEEHLAVRRDVGMFDVSHMGEFVIRGSESIVFLQRLLTNDIERLVINQAQYTLLLNDKGGIIDDLIVYRLAKDSFMLCVNAANIARDWQHILAQALDLKDLHLENISDQYSQIAVQGPKAAMLLKSITDDNLPNRFFMADIALAGINARVARTGYTGEDGFEIFVRNQDVEALWQSCYHHGQALSLKPCGLAARDSLRLEAGLLLHGQDMDETTTPLEAGLMFAVCMNKPNFIGQEVLLKQKRHGINKKLMGFRLTERGIARHGFKILDINQQEIGVVTSGSFPPLQETALGVAYVRTGSALIGQEIAIDIRGRSTKAILMKPRFVHQK